MRDTTKTVVLPKYSKEDAGQGELTAQNLERYFQTTRKNPKTDQAVQSDKFRDKNEL